jgi:hypothetical protein
MNEMYKDMLEILQQRIPIGERQGLILLEKTEGNTDKAEKYFTEERISIIVNKTGIPSEIVFVISKKIILRLNRPLKPLKKNILPQRSLF